MSISDHTLNKYDMLFRAHVLIIAFKSCILYPGNVNFLENNISLAVATMYNEYHEFMSTITIY